MTTFDVYSRLSSGEVELLATIKDGVISGHGRKGVLKVFKVTGIDPADECALSDMIPGSYFEIKPRVKEAQTTFHQLNHKGLSQILEHLPGEHDQKDHGNWANGKGTVIDPKERKRLRRQRRRLEHKDTLTPIQQKKLEDLNEKLGPRWGRKKKSISPTGREHNDHELRLMDDSLEDSGLRPQPGINARAYIANTEDGGLAYVKNLKGFRSTHETGAELAAYELNEQLGFDIVPTTVLRDDLKGDFRGKLTLSDSPSHHVIASEWIEGETLESKGLGQGIISDLDYAANDFEQMLALDVIMGNTDRHSAQILIYDDGKGQRLAALDFGFSLWDKQVGSSGWGVNSAEQAVTEYLEDIIYTHGERLFGVDQFKFDTSKDGPWRQILRQESAIKRTISQSMTSLPEGTHFPISEIMQRVTERFDVIEIMLDRDSFKDIKP